jgi:hypothetical protein
MSQLALGLFKQLWKSQIEKIFLESHSWKVLDSNQNREEGDTAMAAEHIYS